MRRTRHAQDGDLGGIDDGRERGSAYAAQGRNGEAAALHLAGRQLAVACQTGQFGGFFGEFENTLFVGIPYNRNNQAVGGIGSETDVVVLDRKSTRLNSSH